MITRMTDIYADIMLRCGAGYAGITNRARELFWRTVATMVKNREFSSADIAGMTNIDEVEVELFDFPFDLLDGITDHIFDLDVNLLTGAPATAILSYVEPGAFDAANLARKTLTRSAKLPEVIWTRKNQNILVYYDPLNTVFADGYLLVQRTIYSVPNSITANDAETTAFAGYFSTAFATKAIELTVPALIQEFKG